MRRNHRTRELHFIRHTITAIYVQKKAESTADYLLTGKTHTFLTEYHGIHTDKLVSPVSVGFKFIYHYIIDLFSVLFLFLYHTTLQVGESLSGERTPSPVTSLVGVRSIILNPPEHSTLSATIIIISVVTSLTHSKTEHACVTDTKIMSHSSETTALSLPLVLIFCRKTCRQHFFNCTVRLLETIHALFCIYLCTHRHSLVLKHLLDITIC